MYMGGKSRTCWENPENVGGNPENVGEILKMLQK